MSNSEEDNIVCLKGVCDPRKSMCCWWDEYPLDTGAFVVHAYTVKGVAVGAFCSDACANAWALFQRSSSLYRDIDVMSTRAAPPREMLKRFGGTVSKKNFRGVWIKNVINGKRIKTVTQFELGNNNSSSLLLKYYAGEARDPFTTCNPMESKVCWWDSHDLPDLSRVVRTAVFYSPAKRLFTKDRYRFSESVDKDYPDRTRDEMFVEHAAFCSVGCRKAWVLYTFERTPRAVDSCLQLDEIRMTLDGRPSPVPKPSRLALYRFGGFMGINEFRDEQLPFSECIVTPRIDTADDGLRSVMLYDINLC